MWHEARRQERKIRGMLVDYRRRAERRRDFYEKIKADPTQFLQVHGRQCKIHLDPNIAAASDSAVMMPWQGQSDILIDRFDGRAHLDNIFVVTAPDEPELSQEDRQMNYERYRIIAQNSFLGIPEEKFLKQLHLEEQFGYTEIKSKRESRNGGAAIGFNYEDITGTCQSLSQNKDEDSDDNDSDSDLDVDLAINVSKMDPGQAHDMNKHGRSYGMSSNDFYSFLTNDLEEAETARLAREEEQEKALFSGRKSRRERRHHREKRLANRILSPPSYAAKTSPSIPTYQDSKSRSASPEVPGKITYITSFGDDAETLATRKTTYADKVKYGKSKRKIDGIVSTAEITRKSDDWRSRGRSPVEKVKLTNMSTRSRSRSCDRRSRSVSRHRKFMLRRSTSKSRRTNSLSTHKSTRRTMSRSRSRSRRRISKSRSRSRHMRSNSQSRSKNIRSYSRSRSRSRSRSKTIYSSSNRRRIRRYSSSSISSSASSRMSISLQSLEPSGSPSKKSPENSKNIIPASIPVTVPTAIPRYYGRKKSDQSSSETSSSEDINYGDMQPAYTTMISDSKTGHGNTSTAIKASPINNRTVIERLKRKRQVLLNRQFKADKVAEQQKTEREKLEQRAREDELREMAIKLRRRQREIRHANDSRSSSSSSDSICSKVVTDSGVKMKSPTSSRFLEKNHPSQSGNIEINEEGTRMSQSCSTDIKYGNRERRYKERKFDKHRRERRSTSPKWNDRREKETKRREYNRYSGLVDY